MAITPDTGVRSNAAIDLGRLSEADQALIARRQTAAGAIPGMTGVDVPINAPPHSEPHVPPAWVFYGTFAALIVLTAATVWARSFDLGNFNIFIALGLAVIKSILVALFFMHLFWDSKFNQLVVAISIAFVGIFIAFTITDTDQYQPTVQPRSEYTVPVDQAAPQAPTGESH